MLPPEVDEAWIVPAAEARGDLWNGGLDEKLHELVSLLEECYIPRIIQPAALSTDEVKANTGISPFPRNEWIDRLIDKPTVTFMYRPDRCWGSHQILISKFIGLLPAKPTRLRRIIEGFFKKQKLRKQRNNIVCLATILRKTFGDIEFAVAGTCSKVSFPSWIVDIRSDSPGEKSNRATAVQCSKSHLMISIGGSHMVLPSAFAGAVLYLQSYP